MLLFSLPGCRVGLVIAPGTTNTLGLFRVSLIVVQIFDLDKLESSVPPKETSRRSSFSLILSTRKRIGLLQPAGFAPSEQAGLCNS